MFGIRDRDRLRDRVIQLATSDARVEVQDLAAKVEPQLCQLTVAWDS